MIVEIAYQQLSANPQTAVLLSWWFSRGVGNWYQIGCLVVNQFTTKRSNSGKTTTKHRFYGENTTKPVKWYHFTKFLFTGGFLCKVYSSGING